MHRTCIGKSDCERQPLEMQTCDNKIEAWDVHWIVSASPLEMQTCCHKIEAWDVHWQIGPI
jgi:hypothetical protein